MSTPDFAKGASGPENQYAGLGLNLAYLGGAHASASATAGSGTTGTSFPSSPSDAQLYTYVADGTNGVLWKFSYYATGGFWAFAGGPPLWSLVDTNEGPGTHTGAYVALATAGPSIVLPFAGDFDVEIGARIAINQTNGYGKMSYDIGGTGAVDADCIEVTTSQAITGNNFDFESTSKSRRKTGLTAVTLTAKYADNVNTSAFRERWMKVWPVKV